MFKRSSVEGSVSVEIGPAKIKGDDIPITYIAVIGLIAVAFFLIYAKYIHRRAVNHVKWAVQHSKDYKKHHKKHHKRKNK